MSLGRLASLLVPSDLRLPAFSRRILWTLASPSVPPPPDTPDGRAAVHEAGHVVAAWCCTAVWRVLEVTLDARGGQVACAVDGQGEAIDGGLELPAGEAGAWCYLARALAGLAAELRVYQRASIGRATHDLERARRCALALAGSAPPWARPFPALVQGLPFEGVFDPPLSPSEHEAMGTAYAMAQRIVRTHAPHVQRIAGHLLERGRLGEPELVELLGRRGVVRALGAVLGPTFLVPDEVAP